MTTPTEALAALDRILVRAGGCDYWIECREDREIVRAALAQAEQPAPCHGRRNDYCKCDKRAMLCDAAPKQAEQPARHPWQPMKTAPKDGTTILVLAEGSDVPRGVRWTEADDERGFDEAGWRMSWDDYLLSRIDGPRYWMHCPDDPDDQAEQPADARQDAGAGQAAGHVWDEFGRTNAGDETGGAVQRFGFDLTGDKPEILPATNGAFVWYSDYLTLHHKHAALSAQPAPVAQPVDLSAMVSRFLTWPLPSDVCADPCASFPGYGGDRTGTNLLTATQAEAMLRYVLDGYTAPRPIDWLSVLPLVNEYAAHVADAALHQAESRADVSRTAALKTLGKLRAALAAAPKEPQA